MKILFLDIDGVLSSNRTAVAYDGYPHDIKDMQRFDHVAIHLIRKLCELTETKIVLSSDWRFTYSADDISKAMNLPVIGITPKEISKDVYLDFIDRKTQEIWQYLCEHQDITHFAVVDHFPGLAIRYTDKFVKIDEQYGLSLQNYFSLVNIFWRGYKKMKLIRDIPGVVNRKKGEIICLDGYQWSHPWQDMSSDERTKYGIYVHCYGHGEFEVIRVPQDAILIND